MGWQTAQDSRSICDILKPVTIFIKMDIVAQVTRLMLHDLPLDENVYIEAAYPVWRVNLWGKGYIRHSRKFRTLSIHKLYVNVEKGIV